MSEFSALEEATIRIDQLELELSEAQYIIQRVRELLETSKPEQTGDAVNDALGEYQFFVSSRQILEILDGEQ